MKKSNIFNFLLIFSLVVITSCSSDKKKTSGNVPSGNDTVTIEILPMYGSTQEFGNYKKNSVQIEADREFLVASDESIPDRTEASNMYLGIAWHYIESEKLDDAMRRANQAWLLDPLNADVYVTFADILNKQNHLDAAMDMFERAANLASNKVALYEYYLNEAYNYYKVTQDNKYIQKVLDHVNQIQNITDPEEAEKLSKIKEDAKLYLKS